MRVFPQPDPARATPVPTPGPTSAPRLTPAPAPAPAATRDGAAETTLRRPALLMRAAREGAALYRRDRHLKGVAPGCAGRRRSAREVAARLAALEAECEAARRERAPDYAVARHVLLLSALLAERSAAACGG